eukprot:6211970-Pleurochrysis_carterae.AAC.2
MNVSLALVTGQLDEAEQQLEFISVRAVLLAAASARSMCVEADCSHIGSRTLMARVDCASARVLRTWLERFLRLLL